VINVSKMGMENCEGFESDCSHKPGFYISRSSIRSLTLGSHQWEVAILRLCRHGSPGCTCYGFPEETLVGPIAMWVLSSDAVTVYQSSSQMS
jgi:hypothetical protein